jgi:hypothetical protein
MKKIACAKEFTASAHRRFKFQKNRQHFIRVHNETPSRRHDARLQSRLSFPRNPLLKHSPNSNRIC